MNRPILKIVLSVFIFISIISLNCNDVSALPYYDLRFEKISEDLVRGEYERIGEEIKLQEDTDITMLIKKIYNIDVNASLSKDEEDAIGQVFGTKWNQKIEITKEEDIKIKGNISTYVEVRPVYKEIRGYIVQDFNSWSKKKEIRIKIPIDVEYNINTQS
ncbi:MAG: hypothetical protein ACRC92_24415 [Peptostreptococcaceae bacterium]